MSFKCDALIEVEAATGGDGAERFDSGGIGKAVGGLAATMEDEREESKSEIVEDLLVETCIAALEAGGWTSACGER